MPYLKAQAPSDVAKLLKEAEAQADDCWRARQIRYYPTNVAIWAQRGTATTGAACRRSVRSSPARLSHVGIAGI